MRLESFIDPDKKVFTEESVKVLNFKERMLRTAKGSGLFLGLALVALPIPVVHLFLVPICLFLSLFMFIWFIRQKIFVEIPQLKCPKCQTPQKIQQGLAEWPIRTHCSECRSQIIVRPAT